MFEIDLFHCILFYFIIKKIWKESEQKKREKLQSCTAMLCLSINSFIGGKVGLLWMANDFNLNWYNEIHSPCLWRFRWWHDAINDKIERKWQKTTANILHCTETKNILFVRKLSAQHKLDIQKKITKHFEAHEMRLIMMKMSESLDIKLWRWWWWQWKLWTIRYVFIIICFYCMRFFFKILLVLLLVLLFRIANEFFWIIAVDLIKNEE